MHFGDPAFFSMELEIDQNSGGAWMFGKCCYWIGGEVIGDYGLGTSLRDALPSITQIVKDCGNRQHPHFFDATVEHVVSKLNGALYGNGSAEDDEAALDEVWARFNVTINVDVFDSWKIFLIDGIGESRMLCTPSDDARVKETRLALGAFDEAITSAHAYLNRIYEQEATSEER